MTTKPAAHRTVVRRIFSPVALLALSCILMAVPVTAQPTTISEFELFGVNMVGTMPKMNTQGRITVGGQMRTPDSRLILNIPAGTFIRNAAGLPQEFISATQVTEPPPAPVQQRMLFAFSLGTPGATFNPTVGMSLLYHDIVLPQGATDNSLYIASWNGTEWVKLSSTVDAAAKTVSTTVSGFTTYALMVNLQPPVTTTNPPPSTTTSQPTTTPATATSVPTSPADSSEPKSNSMIIILGAGALALVLVLVLLARKR